MGARILHATHEKYLYRSLYTEKRGAAQMQEFESAPFLLSHFLSFQHALQALESGRGIEHAVKKLACGGDDR